MNTKLDFKQIIIAGAKAAGLSVVINVILFYAFHAAGVFTDNIMVQPNQPLSSSAIIIASIVPSLIGACVFFLFEKYANNGLKKFTITSIVLLVLTAGNPFFGIPNVTVAYALVLDVMHVVVAGSLLFFINTAKRRS